MPLIIEKGDIFNHNADPIVIPIFSEPVSYTGLEMKTYEVFGVELSGYRREYLEGLPMGCSCVFPKGMTKSKDIFFTTTPRWIDGSFDEEKLLVSCYMETLECAERNKLGSVVFPLLGTGVFGFSPEEAFRIAKETIDKFLEQSELTVYLVLHDKQATVEERNSLDYYIFTNYYGDIKVDFSYERSSYHRFSILYKYYEVLGFLNAKRDRRSRDQKAERELKATRKPRQSSEQTMCMMYNMMSKMSLDDYIEKNNKPVFVDILNEYLRKSGKRDSEIYTLACIEKSSFSRIHSGKRTPSKDDIMQLCLALELSLDGANRLLNSAGFCLSGTSKKDIIFEYMVIHKEYKVYDFWDELDKHGIPV